MPKLTSIDFARLWEAIPKLSEKHWQALVARRAEVEAKRDLVTWAKKAKP